MSYKVKVVGILKANGQLANYGDILEDADLIDSNASLKEGYIESYEDPKTKTNAKAKVEAPVEEVDDSEGESASEEVETAKEKKMKPLI